MNANRPPLQSMYTGYENLRDHSQRDRGNPYLSEPDKSLTFPMALWFPVLPLQETPFCFAGVTEITIMAFLWSDIPFTVPSHRVTFLPFSLSYIPSCSHRVALLPFPLNEIRSWAHRVALLPFPLSDTAFFLTEWHVHNRL